MIISGEKVYLRAVEEHDNEMLLELINDPQTEMMLGGSSWPVSKAGQLNWFRRLEESRDILRCIVVEKDTNKAVGTVMLSDISQKNGVAQIHIKLVSDGGRGKGYGYDAITSMISYAFRELRLQCVYAEVVSYNNPSMRLFEKCGFQKEGILRSRVYKGGGYKDLISFSILANDVEVRMV